MTTDSRRHTGIEVVSLLEFVRRTAGGHFPSRNTSVFNNLEYDCACGRTHRFDARTTSVRLEVPGNRIVLQCPDAAAVTCVEVKGPRTRLVTAFGARKWSK